MFALGAAIGASTAMRNSFAILFEGILIQTYGFCVTISGIHGSFFNRRVIGQGNNLSIICC
jgi:hypothetical protein